MVASVTEKRVVIALCGSEKKHRQSFDKLRVCIDRVNARNKKNGGSCIVYSLVKMHYDVDADEISTETGEDVDVVLHKLTTLHPKSADALSRWCIATSWRRSLRDLPPVIMVDPLSVTRLVLQRSSLSRLLHGRLVRPFCPMPQSWLWTRQNKLLTRISLSSLATNWDCTEFSGEKNCLAQKWWIVKPDLSTGPAFTHHMVIWRGGKDASFLPTEVQQLLPREIDEFVVQEFLSFALPVVIKVYRIGTHVFLKAVDTEPLMRYVLSDTGAPVVMDSQKKFESDARWEQESLRWKSYLAKGGCIHTQCSQLATQLAELLGLTLFGFDLLLVPKHFCSHGRVVLDIPSASLKELLPTSHNTFLFDELTGNPTQLLYSAVPVLVDVNYFPGFAGVEEVGERILELIESAVVKTSVLWKQQSTKGIMIECHCL